MTDKDVLHLYMRIKSWPSEAEETVRATYGFARFLAGYRLREIYKAVGHKRAVHKLLKSINKN